MKILRTANLVSNFTGSYKKEFINYARWYRGNLSTLWILEC